jgi:hypothetical protein
VNEGAFRGIVLVAIAVVIGLILLSSGLDDTVSTARVDDSSASTDGDDEANQDDESEDNGSVDSPVAPSSINVIVANGAGVDGAAATISATLTGLQYNVLEPTNTTVEPAETPLDTVYYQTSPNTQAQAEQVAEDLALPASVVLPFDPATAPAQIGLAQVLVVLGSSPGQLATGSATGTSTPTTVAG